MKTTTLENAEYETKSCCCCKIEKPFTMFGQRGQHRDCRPCRTEYQKKWNAKNKDKISAIKKKCREKNREKYGITARIYYSRKDIIIRKRSTRHRSRLNTRFGITPEYYSELLELQEGGCAICGIKPNKRRLAIDHNHKTGKVRGLLCTSCNTSLGLMRESVELINNAAEYIRRHNA